MANFKEVDPELGPLNLSKGGLYPVEYAIHLGAGFGSQISMMLLHWTKTKDGVRRSPNALGYAYRIADPSVWNTWLTEIAGHPVANLEVIHRTLRVRDQAVGTHVSAAHQKSSSQTAIAVPQNLQAVVDAVPGDPSTAIHTTASAATSKMEEVTPAPKTINEKADPIKERVLALVAEKTGYPVDMLDLDLDLEADLGVDTVKQAEVFAAIREIYNIARDENRKLRDYPTLAHVIRFVNDKRPDLAAATAPALPEASLSQISMHQSREAAGL